MQTVVWTKVFHFLLINEFVLKMFKLQILMTASQIPVKTTEPVKTWSTTTTAIVFLDLLGETVKTVSTANSVFSSDQ